MPAILSVSGSETQFALTMLHLSDPKTSEGAPSALHSVKVGKGFADELAIVLLGLLLLIGATLLPVKAFHGLQGQLERRILRLRLKALGIEPGVFSEECLDELIECGCGTKVRQLVGRTAAIEGVAINVASVCFGNKGYTAQEINADLGRGYPHDHTTLFWKVLARHHPERFGLNELDRTQSLNKLSEAETSMRI